MRTRRARKAPVEAEKPPKISTREQLFVALWRFKMELARLDFSQLEMSESDIAEARYSWGQIVVGLRNGLAATHPPAPEDEVTEAA